MLNGELSLLVEELIILLSSYFRMVKYYDNLHNLFNFFYLFTYSFHINIFMNK